MLVEPSAVTVQVQQSVIAGIADAGLAKTNLDEPYDTLGYLQRLFEPGDWIDLQLIHQENAWPDNNFQFIEAVTPESLRFISAAQDKGWNAFVAMNAFTPNSRRRRVCDVEAVRSVYLDFDAEPNWTAIRTDITAGVIPEPQFVLRSSPKKFYLIWLVKDFTVAQQEALNSALQKRYGSDAAATDAAWVLRLPGTRNLKYPEQPIVRIIKQNSHERYSPSDFKVEVNVKQTQVDAIADEKLQAILDFTLAALEQADVSHNSVTDSDDPAHKIKIVLNECPWAHAPEHHQNGDPTGAAIFISADGKLGFKCFHTWCSEHYHWNECRAELEKRAGLTGDQHLRFGESVRIPILTNGETEFQTLIRNLKPIKLIAYVQPEDVERIDQLHPIEIQIGSKPTLAQVVVDPVVPADTFDIPVAAMASSRLGDIYNSIFEPNGWTLNFALPALVTAASVLVPRSIVPEGQLVIGGDNLTNLYTALIGKVHGGKSQCIEWAAKSLGIYHEDYGEHYIDISAGSAEQLIDALDRRKNQFKCSVLVDQDEYSYLFTKAGIPNATFASFLTKSFYRRRQIFSRPKGKEVVLNIALSFFGGIVEDDFDSVFNASTLGGCYDRFLFGHMPSDWAWNYRPFPHEKLQAINDPNLLPWSDPEPVVLNGSVFEVGQAWAKQNPELGRITEICIRIATIFASMDGRRQVTGKDLEVLSGLAAYQLGIRHRFQPNAGQNPDAQFSNAAQTWIDHKAENWTNISQLKNGVHAYEQRLGPIVAVRALSAMAQSGRIELWLNRGENQLPTDYAGKQRPHIGLVRKIVSGGG